MSDEIIQKKVGRPRKVTNMESPAVEDSPYKPSDNVDDVSIDPPLEKYKKEEPVKKKWRFYSRKNDLIVAFETDIIDPTTGKPMRNAQTGAKLTELHTVKFKWQRFTTSDETIYKMLIQAPGYGGDVENGSVNSSALYWLNGYPKDVLDDLKRQRQYLTHDPNAYESDTEFA